MLFITIYKNKKQIKLDLGVQMQHCVNACNQTSSVRNNRGRGEHWVTGDGTGGGEEEVWKETQIKL